MKSISTSALCVSSEDIKLRVGADLLVGDLSRSEVLELVRLHENHSKPIPTVVGYVKCEKCLKSEDLFIKAITIKNDSFKSFEVSKEFHNKVLIVSKLCDKVY